MAGRGWRAGRNRGFLDEHHFAGGFWLTVDHFAGAVQFGPSRSGSHAIAGLIAVAKHAPSSKDSSVSGLDKLLVHEYSNIR
jgi:hypothetical protein